MRIIEASVDQLATVSDIAQRTWPVAYREILSPGQLAYMLRRMYDLRALEEHYARGHRFLLALPHDRAVGFAGFEHHYQGGSSTRLHKLYVLPHTQGSGAGTALLQAVFAAARTAGNTRVELNVNRYNPARHFYARHGFSVLRDEVIDIGEGYVMDDHVMVRPVAGT
jgi:GNAT superfamily N-acetyltransferase